MSQFKKCSRCFEELPVHKFHRRAARKIGRRPACIECEKKENEKPRNKAMRFKNKIKHMERRGYETAKTYFRNYYLEHKKVVLEKARIYQREYRKQNKDKVRARNKIHQAIDQGRLYREPCEVCGNQKTEAHHDNYSKPLDVQWLCRKHHSEHHRKYELKHGKVVIRHTAMKGI